MGLLDRFKKPSGPDALTWEAVARARAVPGVAGADAVDADTVLVTWAAQQGTTTLSLADVREAWTKASGFDRIELMDEVVAGLAPPPPEAEPAPGPAPEPQPAPPAETSADDPWTTVRGSVSLAVVPAGAPGAGAVRWSLGAGLDAEATSAGQPITADDLERWQVDPAEVRGTALARLGEAGPALDPIAPGARAWVPAAAVAPAPAWLAEPALLLAAAGGLDEAVALAPLPSELVVVDPAETELLGSVLTSTIAIVEGDAEVLLAAPLLVTPAGVVPWVPEPEHPCAALVARLRAAG